MYIRTANSESHTLVAFFVTSCQKAFSYSLNIGEQDCISWHLRFLLDSRKFENLKFCLVNYYVGLKMQNFQAGFQSFSFGTFASTEVRP